MAGAPPRTLPLILLVFLSGACALTYEVAWQQMLTLVFGITTHATTVILASFMGGMALGGCLFGRLADRIERPVRVFAALELSIAATAALFPLLVPLVMRAFVAAPASMHGSGPLSIGLRLALCFPLLLLPAALMGGTLPVLSRLAERRPERTGRWLGLVYGGNTLGAVVGCALAGFVLIPALGVRQSALLANGVNLLIGACALLLCRDLDRAPTTAPTPTPAAGGPERPLPPRLRRLLLATALISGGCALAFEVLWTRILTAFLQANAYAFPTMLATFLAGAALGSLLFARLLDRGGGSLALLGFAQAAIGLLALVSAYQVTRLRELQPAIGAWVGPGWTGESLAGFGAAAFIMLAPCLLMGASFPLVCRIHARGDRALGGGVGLCYAFNTAGGVAGAALAGFAAIPLLGVTRSVVAVSIASGLLGGALLLCNPLAGRAARATQLTLLVAAFAAAAAWLIPRDLPIALFSLDLRDVRSDPELLYYHDGAAGTVTVMKSAAHYYESRRFTFIEVNGVEVAGDSPMLRTTQKVQGHVPPMLFRALNGRRPATAFVLGFGSGEASGCSVLHVTERLDCLELCAGEIGANRHFRQLNGHVLDNPRFRLIINDARNHLLTTRERYDVIMSDSTHPAVASDTYTLEYYRLCRDRLTPGGVFSTWVPLYDMTAGDIRCLLRTMLEAFGRVSIWYPHHYSSKHAIFVATRRPLRVDVRALARDLARPDIRDSFATVDVRTPADVLALFVADQRTIGPAVTGAPLNADDNLRLSLGIPRNARRGEQTVPENLALFESVAGSVLPHLTGQTAALDRSLRKRERIRDLVMRGVGAGYANDRKTAIAAFAAALELRPDPTVRYLLRKARFDEAYAEGVAAAQAGDYPVALGYFESALQIRPGNVHVLNFSGACYFNMNRPARAAERFRQALATLPDSSWSRFNLARALAALGQKREARAELRQILAAHPRMAQVSQLLARIGQD